MSRFRKKKKRTTPTPRKPLITPAKARQLLIVAALAAGAFTMAAAGAMGFVHLEAYVSDQLLSESPATAFDFVDLPDSLAPLARVELESALHDVRERPWTDPDMCRDIAERIERTGWLSSLRHVRRTPGGRFEISGNYRRPAALVQKGSDFLLVDWEGVRLPGTYVYHPMWKLVQGVAAPPVSVGKRWDAADLQVGLSVLAAIRNEPYASQISAVLVDNFDGRRNTRSAHVELATDRPGGRILWGSPPGREVEENSVVQKLAILKENFRRSGRVDADFLVIDITTFKDRFTVPN